MRTSQMIIRGVLVAMLFFVACTDQDAGNAPEMEVSLYFGIDQIAHLGDTEAQVLARRSSSPKKKTVTDSKLNELHLTDEINFSNLGVRIYFRYNRVALIEIQQPFHGSIHGKKMKLFPFKSPPGQTWEDILRREFGPPTSEASGGRMSSNSLFYSWGDISYNAMGPNELAVYRDPDVAKYRQSNFGRILKLFGN